MKVGVKMIKIGTKITKIGTKITKIGTKMIKRIRIEKDRHETSKCI